MITTRTVLVLGAGASAPYDFPTGKQLKDKVVRLSTQKGARQLLTECGFSEKQINCLAQSLGRSGQSSIDAFLERRPELQDVGKAAIAAMLLPHESDKHLFPMGKRNNRSDSDHEDNWYELLFNMLTEGAVKWQDLEANELSIITFNYDRSFEHYLFTALQESYGIGNDDARTAASFIRVEHVYGSLGKLPWQGTTDASHIVPYGARHTIENVRRAADSVIILSEGEVNSEAFCQARLQLSNATRVYLLGFGYHPTNLGRLGMQSESMRKFTQHQVARTILGLPAWLESKIDEFPSLENLRRGQGNLFKETVYSFLHKHVTLKGWLA